MEYNSKLCLEKLKAFQDIKENKIENRYTIKKKKKHRGWFFEKANN